MAKHKRYRTTADIIIPAGTVMIDAPTRRSTSGKVDGVIGHGRDHSSTWIVEKDDALELGLIEEIE